MRISARAQRIEPFYVMEMAKSAAAIAREAAGIKRRDLIADSAQVQCHRVRDSVIVLHQQYPIRCHFIRPLS